MRLLLITDDELDVLKSALENEVECAREEAEQSTLGTDEYFAHGHAAQVGDALAEYLAAELDDDERTVCATLMRALVRVTAPDRARAEAGRFDREPEAA